MKAVITMKLIRPTRFKRTIIKKTITSKKDYLTGLINGFIYERVNREHYIPVTEFMVEIFNTRNRCVNKWSYKPTYR